MPVKSLHIVNMCENKLINAVILSDNRFFIISPVWKTVQVKAVLQHLQHFNIGVKLTSVKNCCI